MKNGDIRKEKTMVRNIYKCRTSFGINTLWKPKREKD
jgi:hypothetical protein